MVSINILNDVQILICLDNYCFKIILSDIIGVGKRHVCNCDLKVGRQNILSELF